MGYEKGGATISFINRKIRILLIGDQGVGKTSIISSLVREDFKPNVPAKYEDISIAAEITPERVPLSIIDYSEREPTQNDIIEEIKGATVVCIVYQAGDSQSLNQVKSHWIPIVKQARSELSGDSTRATLVVANKIDLLLERGRIASRTQDFEDVDFFIEVSAVTQENIAELFSAAQKAILYPLKPIFNTKSRTLRKKCLDALTNIFKLCDEDQDGLLNDYELNLFQENCFGTPLQDDALEDLKSIIRQSTKDGIVDDGVTLTGFLFLHNLSVDKGRLEFTWMVLRKFNYDDQINIISENTDLTAKCLNDSTNDEARPKSFSKSNFQATDSFMTPKKLDKAKRDLETPWIQGHTSIITAGLSFTVATFLSMMVIKYVFRNTGS